MPERFPETAVMRPKIFIAAVLQTAGILELEFLICCLDRERCNNAVLRLAEKVDPKIKIEWIIIDDRRIGQRCLKVAELHLRRTAQLTLNAKAFERHILLPHITLLAVINAR